MADDTTEKESQPQVEPIPLTPSQIGKIGSLEATKEFLKATMENVGEERSGQLSPSHTPGRPYRR